MILLTKIIYICSQFFSKTLFLILNIPSLLAPLAATACLTASHLMTLPALRSTGQAFYRISFILGCVLNFVIIRQGLQVWGTHRGKVQLPRQRIKDMS